MKSSTAMQRPARVPSLHLVTADEMLNHTRDSFDRVARRAFEIFQGNGEQRGREIDDWLQAESEIFHPAPVDILEADGALTVKADVPGFEDKDIEINVEPRRVTISGKRESLDEKKEGGGSTPSAARMKSTAAWNCPLTLIPQARESRLPVTGGFSPSRCQRRGKPSLGR